MKISYLASSVLAISLAVAAACGGGQPTTEPPVETAAPSSDMPDPPATAVPTSEPAASASAAPTAETPPPPPAKKAWKDMTADEKKKFMATDVMPAMAKTFGEFDAKEFGKFECVTCHGDAGKGDKATFKMPNPKLPKLDPKDGFKKHAAKHQKDLDFMMQKVTPQMAQLIGAQPFDPATGQGFGCAGCHEMVKK
ncbi:MAG: hypothetical protein JNL21_04845 [Myxococcales bacterium]|nr:hypothetical protein [Myxococcales bacterium]